VSTLEQALRNALDLPEVVQYAVKQNPAHIQPGLFETEQQKKLDDLGPGHWITIHASEEGHGGHRVYIGDDGKMKTGIHAGKSFDEAFGASAKQKQKRITKRGDKHEHGQDSLFETETQPTLPGMSPRVHQEVGAIETGKPEAAKPEPHPLQAKIDALKSRGIVHPASKQIIDSTQEYIDAGGKPRYRGEDRDQAMGLGQVHDFERRTHKTNAITGRPTDYLIEPKKADEPEAKKPEQSPPVADAQTGDKSGANEAQKSNYPPSLPPEAHKIVDAINANGGHEKNSANDVDAIRNSLYESGKKAPTHAEIRGVMQEMKNTQGEAAKPAESTEPNPEPNDQYWRKWPQSKLVRRTGISWLDQQLSSGKKVPESRIKKGLQDIALEFGDDLTANPVADDANDEEKTGDKRDRETAKSILDFVNSQKPTTEQKLDELGSVRVKAIEDQKARNKQPAPVPEQPKPMTNRAESPHKTGDRVSFQDPTPMASGKPSPVKHGTITGPSSGGIIGTDHTVKFDDGTEDEFGHDELKPVAAEKPKPMGNQSKPKPPNEPPKVDKPAIELPKPADNSAAKSGDQMGLFGEVANVKRTEPVKLKGSEPETAGRAQNLFDTKGDKDQMLMFDDGVTPSDMLLNGGKTEPEEPKSFGAKTEDGYRQSAKESPSPEHREAAIKRGLDSVLRVPHLKTPAQAEMNANDAWHRLSYEQRAQFSGYKEFASAVGKAFGEHRNESKAEPSKPKSDQDAINAFWVGKESGAAKSTKGKENSTGHAALDWLKDKSKPMKSVTESLKETPVDLEDTGIFEGKIPNHMTSSLRDWAKENATNTHDGAGTSGGITYNVNGADGKRYSLTLNAKTRDAKLTFDHRGEEPAKASSTEEPGFSVEVPSQTEPLKTAKTKTPKTVEQSPPVAESKTDTKSETTDPGKPSYGSFDAEKHGGYKPLLKLAQDINDGKLSHEEFQAAHKMYHENRENFLADLNKRFNAQQLKNIAGNLGMWPRPDAKKSDNANLIHERLMQHAFDIGKGMSNSWGMDELRNPNAKHERLAKHVQAQTADSLKAHVEANAGRRKEREELEAKAAESKANPQTLGDYRGVMREKKYLDLTPEQRRKYDELAATESREKRKSEQASKAEVQQFSGEGQGLDFNLSKNFHSKRGHDIFTATPGARVDRGSYDEMNTAAKRLGGWYYKQYGSTPAGFHFPTEEARDKFLKLQSGNVDRSDQLEQMKKERSMTASQRMASQADRMEERANETLNADRKTNTARRADMAAGMRGRAESEIAHAKTMRRIAEGLENGELKHLDGISQSTHLQELNSVARRAAYEYEKQRLTEKYGKADDAPYHEREAMYNGHNAPTVETADHAEYPYPKLWASEVRQLAERLKGKRGVKWDRAALEHMAAQASANEDKDGFVSFNEKSWDTFKNAHEKLQSIGGADWETRRLLDRMKATAEPVKRLKAANIHNEHELRQALREYIPLKSAKRDEDPVAKAERKLVGTKHAGFFPTPPSVIDRMLGNAGIEDGHDVLEPSAGKGDILDQVKRNHPGASLKALELNSAFNEVLGAKGHDFENGDFLKHDGKYDRIVMNPPFENGQDMEHVKHAYSLLKPGGRLVAVMAHGGTAKRDEFDRWASELGGEIEPLPQGSFAGSDAFRKTGVNTKLVTIDKPGGENTERYSILTVPSLVDFWVERYSANHSDKEWIGVDLDGTLAKYDEWKGIQHIGEPIPEMADRVRSWLKSGKQIKIFTARASGNDKDEATRVIQDWTEKHFGKKFPVTNIKDHHMVELWDDRAVGVEKNTGKPKVVKYSSHEDRSILSLLSDIVPIEIVRYEWNANAHPRWQAGAPGGTGGEFRGASSATGGGTSSANAPQQPRSNKKRELAELPDIKQGHPLHYTALDNETQQRLIDWNARVNQVLAPMQVAAGQQRTPEGKAQAEEFGWGRVDKNKVRELLDEMNKFDRETQLPSGMRISDYVNANGLIPKELGERLDTGDRFFNPEKLRGKVNKPIAPVAPDPMRDYKFGTREQRKAMLQDPEFKKLLESKLGTKPSAEPESQIVNATETGSQNELGNSNNQPSAVDALPSSSPRAKKPKSDGGNSPRKQGKPKAEIPASDSANDKPRNRPSAKLSQKFIDSGISPNATRWNEDATDSQNETSKIGRRNDPMDAPKPSRAKKPKPEPTRKPTATKPETAKQSTPGSLSKIALGRLNKAIRETIGDNPEAVDHFRGVALDAYKDIKQAAEQRNEAYRSILSFFDKEKTDTKILNRGTDKEKTVKAKQSENRNPLLKAIRNGDDPSTIPHFDEMIEYAKREFPSAISSGSGESETDSAEDGLYKMLRDGEKPIPKPHDEEVINRAVDMVGPGFFESIQAPENEYAMEENEEPVPFSVDRDALVTAIVRYWIQPIDPVVYGRYLSQAI
jgi:hypothetical protein